MTLQNAKALVKKIGIRSWIESGYDITLIGDKWLGNKESISRLEYAAKCSKLNIYEDEKTWNTITGPCCYFGRIVLNNNKDLWYTIQV